MRGKALIATALAVALVGLTLGCASSKNVSTQATAPEVDPKDPLAATLLMQQGQALVADGKIDAGIQKLEAARKLQPKNPTVHNMLGVALLRRGDATRALDEFNVALQLAPSYSDARNNRAAAYVQLGQLSMAEADYLTVLGDALYANRAGVYFNLGSLYFGRGNLLAAEENLRKAAVPSGPVDAHLLLGQVEEQLGKLELAESVLRQGIARAPERADLVLALAELLDRQGRRSEALELYRRILNQAPNSPEAETARARVGG